MKISVITINFNNCDGLKKTIESVINQTYTDYEYIIIDGGSTDGSVDVIKQYADKITYWVSEPDNGIYNAMNKGTAVATGDYCLYLNSGDYLYNDSVLLKVSEIDSKEDIICGNTLTDKGAIITPPKEVSLKFFIEGSLNHPAAFISSKLIKSLKYDESYKIISDHKFFLEALIFNSATYLAIDLKVSVFDCSGISSTNRDLLNAETNQMLNSTLPQRILSDYIKPNDNIFNLFKSLSRWSGRNYIYTLIVFILKIIKLNRGWISKFPLIPQTKQNNLKR